MTAHLARLCAAIEVLCRVHTKDDPELAFTVELSARPDPVMNGITQTDYVEAWRALREIIGLPYGVRLHERVPMCPHLHQHQETNAAYPDGFTICDDCHHVISFTHVARAP